MRFLETIKVETWLDSILGLTTRDLRSDKERDLFWATREGIKKKCEIPYSRVRGREQKRVIFHTIL